MRIVLIFETYVVYGMNVFEYDHTEKQRILENQSNETATHQSQGDNRKKYRREEERTTKRGWDQYLPKESGAQCPDPVIVTVLVVVTVALNVIAGGPGHPRVSVFFDPRTDSGLD